MPDQVPAKEELAPTQDPVEPASAVPAEVFASVYNLLREMASKRFAGERKGHTLQPTALVHEVFLRVAPDRSMSRPQLLRIAAKAMRHVLCDHARARLGRRRGGRIKHVPVLSGSDEPAAPVGGIDANDLIDLDAALDILDKIAPLQAQVVELHFFGGLTFKEVADVLTISLWATEENWREARKWLKGRLQPGLTSEP